MGKKSARIKNQQSLALIDNWQEADSFVRKIGDLQEIIYSLEADAKIRIDKIKEDLVSKTQKAREGIELCVLSLEAFSANHLQDFGTARSKKLNFGILGWRKSSSISIAKTTLEKIKEIFGRAAGQYLRIKEDVNKEALEKLTDEQLAPIGAQRKEKDVFYVEPAVPQAADYPAQS